MLSRRSPRRSVYSGLKLQKLPRSRRRRRIVILLCAAAMLLYGAYYLRRLSSEIAISDACDAVNLAVSETVARILADGEYDGDYFVRLEKDANGDPVAITTDAVRINRFSSLVLQEITTAADSRRLDVRIPLGSLLGFNLLLGRGPGIPVEIVMLTNSYAGFENELVSTGINQSLHRIMLRTSVDVDILIPWATLSTTVVTDVLLAETVIIGRVPQTYISHGG